MPILAETPRLAEPEELLRTRWLTIRRIHADFGAFEKVYDVVVFGPRAGVVAVRDGRILMTRQYRFLPDTAGWEIPGGKIDQGEDAWTSAQRECLEETGILCEAPEPLLTYYPGLDNVDNQTSLFLSHKVRVEKPFVPHPSEVFEIAWISLSDVLLKIFVGEIQDAFTQIAVLAYAARQAFPDTIRGAGAGPIGRHAKNGIAGALQR